MKYKEGFKSSEFYVALVGIAGILWTAIQAQCNFTPEVIIGIASAVIAYIVQRGWVKNKSK